MYDSYVEHLVKRKTPPVYIAARFLVTAFAVVMIAMSLIGFFVLLIPGLILGLAAYLILIHSELEYEYLYVSKEFSVDKIQAQKRRKKMFGINIQDIEILAPVSSHALDRYKDQNGKTYHFHSADSNAGVYMMVCTGEAGMTRLLIEPSEELLAGIKAVVPRKVFEQ